ncbi:MAG TPA: ThiF family adenylyltransferase [Blastocatellia bacterium]|nr:ThiF family adenylyltransferase [Blastocatellia bacterium]
MSNAAFFYHERLHRGAEIMRRVKDLRVAVCGAGALGANLSENLARQGFASLRVIDRDRVEERNLSTQPYYAGDVGGLKAKMLANSLYRALGVKVEARVEELNEANAPRLLSDMGLVVDTFDNRAARLAVTRFCEAADTPCLHAGLAAGYGEVIWNENYKVPSAAHDDLCDYPLARNLAMLTVAIACETMIRFVATGERRNFTITLDDCAVQPLVI